MSITGALHRPALGGMRYSPKPDPDWRWSGFLHRMRRPDVISPIKVMLVVLAVVFAVEAAIMMLLMSGMGPGLGPRILAFLGAPTESAGRSGHPPSMELLLSLIDALVLVAVLCPVLWLLIVRPLRALGAERGELLMRSLTIQEEERAKLARDLHDELGQTQTAILLGIQSITGASSLDQARTQAASVQHMAGAAVETTRRIARGLSPSVLLDFGLGVAVERVCEDIASASGISVHRDLGIGQRRVDPTVEIAAYRVIQEALSNAVRHADASIIRVMLDIVGDELRLLVEDDGRGMAPGTARPPDSHGLGLVGMRERVVLLRGAFAVHASPGSGTRIIASFPLKRPSP